MKKLALVMAIILTFYAPFGGTLSAWAGCKSDCQDQYQLEVESCHSTYDNPDESDELKTCIDNAQDQHDRCIKECES